MKISRPVTVEVRVSPWVRVDGSWETSPWIGAYRIWLMHDAQFGRWWQCHEWERNDGNRERSADGWIAAIGSRYSSWPAHYAEPAPGEEPPL